MAVEPVTVDVLGPLRVHGADGADRTPGGERQRRLLAALVLHRGRTVSVDALTELLWSGDQPRDPAAAVQTHVFRLRQLLPDGAVTSSSAGYRLDPGAVIVDADDLHEAVHAASTDGDGDATAVQARLDAALARWRGAPYLDLLDTDDGRAEASRLDELRHRAREERAAASLRLGRSVEVVADLVALADDTPLRERPRQLLMEALAADGRTADALRVYDDFRRTLADELGIEPSPTLSELHRSLLSGTAPATPNPVAANLLPRPATSLVGRDELVAAALDLTTSYRLVTLLGTGGVGKTRLAIEIGHRLSADRPDRPVVLVELAGATVANAVDTVATALGVETQTGVPLTSRIASVLTATELVLILDNCEHVLEPIAHLVEHVVAHTAAVTVVATSQERLRLPAEHLCPVPPLPQPTEAGGPAVDLFVERARSVRPGWEPGAAQRATIAEIVHRLDCLPLAIELAAARTHTLDIGDIAIGLDRRFRLLTAGARTSTRHRSLHAAVAWSYDLLSPEEQRFLAALSVFASPFPVADAAFVAGVDTAVAAETLATLAERSLVVAAGGGRHVLLETLRAFGAELLEAEGRSAAVGARHAQQLLTTAAVANSRMSGDGAEGALDEIDARLPDLRVAVEWMIDHGDVDGASELLVVLDDYGFYRLRGEVLGWSTRVLALDPDGRHPRAPVLHAAAAIAAWMSGDAAGIGRHAEAAVRAQAGDDIPSVAANAAGSWCLWDGRLDDANRWYRHARESAATRSAEVMAFACELLAHAYGPDTDVAAAVADDLLDHVGPWRSPAASFAWYAAGEAVMRTDPATAAERLRTAIDLAAASGATMVTGAAGASLASIEARSGDPKVAAASFRRLIDHWRRAGMWSSQWTMLRSVAGLLERLDRPIDAAVITGAVTTTREGHRIFGDDAIALAALAERLRARLGDAAYDGVAAEGAAMDGEAAVARALAGLAVA